MRTLLLCLTASLAMTACVHTSRNEATGKLDVDVESPTKKGEDWNAGLKGMGNFASVTGQVKATTLNGQLEARIAVSGATAGGQHPWMIHEGTCNLPGSPIGTMSDYPPITIGADGKGTADAKFQARLNEAKDYIVVVHASMDDMNTVVACGDLDD